MNTTALQDFVTKTAARNRITFGDVRRLQRAILPNGISSREEAELLIRLDAQMARVDSTWIDWLVAAITDFVVWGERPTGAVETEAAMWLKDLLAATGTPTKAARRIAREIRREAVRVEEPMVSFAMEEEIAEAPVQLPAVVDSTMNPPQLAA
jgi:hypothetical protein